MKKRFHFLSPVLDGSLPSSCSKGMHWELSLSILTRIRREHRAGLNVTIYNKCMSASCSPPSQPEVPLP
eukprot:5666018-Amphidinium_carterae.1